MIVRNRSWPAVSLEAKRRVSVSPVACWTPPSIPSCSTKSQLCFCDYTEEDVEGQTTALPSPLDKCSIGPDWLQGIVLGSLQLMLRVGCSCNCQEEQGELRGCCSEVHSVITCMKEVMSRDVAFELVPPGYMGV